MRLLHKTELGDLQMEAAGTEHPTEKDVTETRIDNSKIVPYKWDTGEQLKAGGYVAPVYRLGLASVSAPTEVNSVVGGAEDEGIGGPRWRKRGTQHRHGRTASTRRRNRRAYRKAKRLYASKKIYPVQREVIFFWIVIGLGMSILVSSGLIAGYLWLLEGMNAAAGCQ